MKGVKMTRRAVAVAVLMIAGLVAVACGGETDAPGDEEAAPATTVQDAPAERDTVTVESEDASAVLSIPTGALPEGVTPEDIEIREVSDDPDLFVATEGDPPLAVFRLEPTGLTFAEPVTLRVTVSLEAVPGDVVTFLATEGQEAPELVPTRLENRDEEAGTVTLVTELSHFSELIHYPVNRFSLDVTAPQQAKFGQPFEVQIIVRRNLDVQIETRWRLNSGAAGTTSIQVATERPWFIWGVISAFGPVSPRAVTDRPPRTSLTGNQFTVTETFTCIRAGTAIMDYLALIDHQMWLISFDESTGSTTRFLSDVVWLAAPAEAWDVECMMPHIVASASAALHLTTYTLSPEIPSATFFAWSGADCGSVTGSTTSTMVWNHDEEGCGYQSHPPTRDLVDDLSHPRTVFSLLVIGTLPTGESFELRCKYGGALSGEGRECKPTQ